MNHLVDRVAKGLDDISEKCAILAKYCNIHTT